MAEENKINQNEEQLQEEQLDEVAGGGAGIFAGGNNSDMLDILRNISGKARKLHEVLTRGQSGQH